MKPILYFLVIACCILSPLCAFAEQIAHHGVTADADAAANECISCHDGSLSHIVAFCRVLCDFSTPHSILKRYPPPGKQREYASAATVASKGIKLQNGLVTCISCHNLRNPAKNHLVVDNTNSKLCLICHLAM